jgi:anti-sigma regulatory factor (Ser/Thr protein kinase)
MLKQQHFYPVTEQSQVGEARRRISGVAERLNFDSTGREKVAIVVTELATNLLKHGGGGELVMRPLVTAGPAGIELLALDRGPGMANVAECLRDGYSTTGSLGQGLGSIQRQSADFQLYTAPGAGTALLVQLWPRVPPTTPENPFRWGAVGRPKLGESVSGDGWTLHTTANRCSLLLSDGLGHGPTAATASEQAVQTFLAAPTRSAVAHVEQIHGALQHTRGAAVAVAEVRDEQVHFVGVGNISGRICHGTTTRHLLSQHGIAGHQARKIQPFTQAWQKGALLILHSDGLGTRWNLDTYPGLLHRHPSLIAGVLYRDFARKSDDATVVVVKEQ